MEALKVTRDPTFPTYWNVRGEDGGLRAVLYNPAPKYWHISALMGPGFTERSTTFRSKHAAVAYLHGYQAGWRDGHNDGHTAGFEQAIELRDAEDAQRSFLLEGT